MCGIVGLAGRYSAAEAGELADRMNGSIVHRGPDDAGGWATDGFAFAMRRLSIIDLAGGHQPMWTDDGVGIVFNGEIYNYRALRAELEAGGRVFRSQSDTEVSLHLYHRHGPDMVRRLEGMFAICLYDPRRREVHLLRDRFGVKPLYYAQQGGNFYFASEIKAILAALPSRPDLDRQALHDYLTLRFVPAPDTVWRGVRKLPPGHRLTLSLDSGDVALTRYWRLDFRAEAEEPGRDYPGEFAALFLAAVEKRLLAADVPVGVLLSGGLDSSAVSAAAVELGHRDFHTFSIAFDEGGAYDETPYARAAAAHIGSRHHEVRLGRDAFVDFLPRLVHHGDEPLADLASVPLYFVSELARQEVKVVLSGEGSDELLAGYNFDRLGRMLDRLRTAEAWLPAALRRLLAVAPAQGAGEWLRLWGRRGWRGMLAARPYHMTLHWDEAEKRALWRETARLASSVERIRGWYRPLADRHPIDQLQQVYSGEWLTEDLLMKADKFSMATSLEVREPFLDHALAEWAARLPIAWRVGDARVGYQSKRILRDFCRRRLPQEILERPKQGFPVPAYRWLTGELRGWAEDRLFGPGGRLHELFHMERARPVFQRAVSGDNGAAHKVWILLVLGYWLEAWQ
ncbi:MAG: asparagine synthase (glutamine-hydrolyzing) [Thiobacillaceae bacterium]|jgi:asparagine synthase (glutamine-hydrolysing)|nr:asparagine synthase (glutamine-hydrolyzing) [Thiobacillaceae bacterium]